ncbi:MULTISPECIES: copper homeostasis periplasmic binding protein CopC [Alphaproteobacteria]|jgi:methionine-rich copper-binding protein CopC|uniref:Copper resistance protein C n=6 Tax=Sphingomonadaceae TaxID=41297 RepID=A0A401J830_SPHXE|nr:MULTISPECIES: copper homeostasis periplasmic binding protein CopC [Alphaproteobacteria]KPH66439.1 copper resistance protein CopC [Novosphingobium sp. ST904]MBG6120865.1 methionine-rich copper-binding protein CopC [Sphingobium sp. JAI105]ODU80905.1 MAG: copper resistance protein CopC [Novosphingobium sp. SCN 63-17]OJX93274.1 MAG: copper resistance protein CopC [Novosphingobium sp. 63-713]GBH32826.1 copper resistance protein C [Sphingobium xenophagum]
MEKSMFRKTIFAVAMAASVLTATAAQAHPKLNAATPAANAVVAAPTRIQLVFSEALVAQFSGLDLTMTEMPGMKMAPMKMNGVKATVGADGKTLVATLAKPLPVGTYKVDYHVVSADTHRIQGSYTFKVQ